jgi:hypothetical protein
MAYGAIVAAIATKQKADLNDELNSEIKKAPKYNISKQAFENQAIARQEAYGRNQAIQTAEEGMDQSAADAAYQAANYTTSTSALQATIAAINAGKITSMRDLASQEAQLKSQGKSQLINVNNQFIDEQDKAWNYNVNMPYQMRIASLRDRIKTNSELAMAGVGYEAQTSSAMMSSMGGMMGGA